MLRVMKTVLSKNQTEKDLMDPQVNVFSKQLTL